MMVVKVKVLNERLGLLFLEKIELMVGWLLLLLLLLPLFNT